MTDTHNTKVCSKCGEEKPLSEYYKRINKAPVKRKRTSDGYAAQCKSCKVKDAKIWSQNNPEKRKTIATRWDNLNPEKRKIAIAKSNANSKERHAEWRKQNVVDYARRKRQTDPMFALRFKTRSILLKAFYRFGYKKTSKTAHILGCTFEELKSHIESKFQPGMTWENRSAWHIDHIVPLASATTEQDVIRLNHYTNLQPLWAEDNLRKSDKLDFQL